MKKILCGVLLLGLLSVPVFAADIEICFTVPDTNNYISRTITWVKAQFMPQQEILDEDGNGTGVFETTGPCAGLDPDVNADVKSCFEIVTRLEMRNKLVAWERAKNRQTAIESVGEPDPIEFQ